MTVDIAGFWTRLFLHQLRNINGLQREISVAFYLQRIVVSSSDTAILADRLTVYDRDRENYHRREKKIAEKMKTSLRKLKNCIKVKMTFTLYATILVETEIELIAKELTDE